MITEYELYSDERKEKHNGNSYLTVGGLVCTDKGRDRLLAKLTLLRDAISFTGEIGWKNVSTFYLDIYKAWLNVFFDDPHARYSLLSVNQTSQDWQTFRRRLHRANSHDDPLASAYYQFLLVTFGSLHDSQRWWVFPDSGYFSRDRVLDHVEFLFNRTYKKAFGPKSSRVIRLARALNSKHADLIQLADLLLGCSACAEYAYTPQSSSKHMLLMHFQNRANITNVTKRGRRKISVSAWIVPDRFFQKKATDCAAVT
jgi:hypothetical protein